MPNPNKKSLLINSIVPRSLDEAHRAATPLELFYDLIYVVAIAFLAAELHHALSAWHHVGQSIAMYCLIFFTIWWPWNTYTWFASGYDTDDAQFRLASFAQMIGVIIIAVGVKSAFNAADFRIMLLGYVVMRIPYLLLWVKVILDHQASRPTAWRYVVGTSLLQGIWVVAVLFYPRIPLFVILIFAEMLVPFFAERAVQKGKNVRYHFEHIEERMGLLTIIVLGESVLASVHAFEKLIVHFSTDLAILVAGSIMILFSMWWLYFDDKVEDKLEHEAVTFLWGYGHYFIFASATAVGALIAVNVDVQTDHAKISENAAILGLACSIAIYLISVWFCHDNLLHRQGWQRFELLILAVSVLLIAVLTHSILLIGFAFVTLNIVRLLRQHNTCRSR